MKKLFPLKKLSFPFLLFIISLGLVIFSCFVFFLSFNSPFKPTKPDSEIEYLSSKKMDFAQLKAYFRELSNNKGAVYAYEVLKHAPMPPNTDMHLLGHVVGEVLYQQKGAEGIKFCTSDFRNACSHTIVVGLFLDKGEAALKDIQEACKKAPGGPGAYTMCHHGLGHGVLAFTNYNMEETVKLCKKTGTLERKFQEYPECVGGAIMEQISGGDHDKQTWEKQREVNLKSSDPLYPCNSQVVPEEDAKKLCYIYLTPHLFNLAGENPGGKPTDAAITKAFTFCGQIPNNEVEIRDVCFGGFGKEFVVLARDRDIRNVESMTSDQLKQVIAWCDLSTDLEGQKSCIKYSVGSLFWGGENKRNGAVNFCSLNTTHQTECFKALTMNINRFIKDKNYRQEYCNEVPSSLKEDCTKTLL